MRSWRQIHASFDRFRTRYYMLAEPPLRVPPKASAIRWAWMASNSALAWTHFDEDGDPEFVELHPRMQPVPFVMRLVLLHELSHMRNPKASCSHRDRWWREETRRLAVLGAFTRENVF